MAIFRTKYDKHDRVFHSSGSRFLDSFKMTVDDDGVMELVKDDIPTDVYLDIQSHADSVNLKLILARFSETGDQSIINKRIGQYFDSVDMPKTYAELYQRVVDCENLFNSLPVDIRAKFNHSPSEFFAQYGTPDFMAKINSTSEAKDVVKDVVKEGEEVE